MRQNASYVVVFTSMAPPESNTHPPFDQPHLNAGYHNAMHFLVVGPEATEAENVQVVISIILGRQWLHPRGETAIDIRWSSIFWSVGDGTGTTIGEVNRCTPVSGPPYGSWREAEGTSAPAKLVYVPREV